MNPIGKNLPGLPGKQSSDDHYSMPNNAQLNHSGKSKSSHCEFLYYSNA
jgi:hypothetical protein